MLMYDDVRVDLIPDNAQAVAGYVNGRFQTYPTLVKRFPNAHKLSIAVSSTADAECLDVEPQDATNVTAPPWVRRQLLRGIKRPVVYTSVSNAHALLAALAAAGIPRSAVRLWTAHYTGKSHLCGPQCGFGMNTTADATQFDDHALGKSLDVSLCNDDFFAPSPKPNLRKRVWAAHHASTLKDIAAAKAVIAKEQTRLIGLQAKATLLKRLLRRK